MKQFLYVLIGCIGWTSVFGQDYQTNFNSAFQNGDTTEQLQILQTWESANPKDPELFTSYFNYYFQKARREIMMMTTETPSGETLVIKDSTGQVKGYLANQVIFQPDTLAKAFAKIDDGIKLYPNRLDMRFGKIYVLGQLEAWDRFTREIIKTIQYSQQNDNAWTWTGNEKRENGETFFLTALQDYQLDLYNTGEDSLLENMRKIAQEVLKYYPNHIESLSDLGITYLLNEQYDKALNAFTRAEKIDPKDTVVLCNIAQTYERKGDKENAIAYYKKAIAYGDQQTIDFAHHQIENLEK